MMKIALAQLKSIPGSIEENISQHLKWIEKGFSAQADLFVFPELSITGYEPTLAKTLVRDSWQKELSAFQDLCDQNDISICVGAPTSSLEGICISMLIFSPHKSMEIYSKQYLHEDEKSVFVEGEKSLIIEKGSVRVAPAICYESLQIEHFMNVYSQGLDIYLASVAKSEPGVKKAKSHFAEISKKCQCHIVMVNAIGPSDNFISAGESSVWDATGNHLGQLPNDQQGLLIYDTVNQTIEKLV